MMKKLVLFYLLYALLNESLGHGDGIGEEVTAQDVMACRIDSPDIDKCLLTAFEHIIPKLHNGWKVAHIPPLDPLKLDNVAVNLDQEIIQMKGLLRLRVLGFRNAKIMSLNSTISRDSLDLKMIGYIPHIQADGTFRGKFLSNLVNINNKVVFNLSLTENVATIRVKGVFVERDGERYLQVTRFILNPTKTEGFKIQLKGLFRDEQMTSIITQFINDNWRSMFRQIIAAARIIWEPLLVEGANQVTYNDIPFRALMYFGNEQVYKIGQ